MKKQTYGLEERLLKKPNISSFSPRRRLYKPEATIAFFSACGG
jgi:hypothetical protein